MTSESTDEMPDAPADSSAGSVTDGATGTAIDSGSDRVSPTGTAAAEDAPAQAAAEPRRSRFDHLPSPVFLALLGVTALGGWLAWNRTDPGAFVLVLGAWLLSIVIHEWSHAALAHRWGARDLRGSGLLSLNPFRYPDRFLSVVLPSAYLILGGFGLTGPAHRWEGVRGRRRQTLVALAGPLTNLLLAVLFVAVPALMLRGQPTDSWFWSGLLLVAFVQATAAIVGLLPIPGMDGFAALAPYLPRRWATFGLSDGVRTYAPIAVFALLWIPPVHSQLLPMATVVLESLDLFDESLLLPYGELNFRFWSDS
ncbi:site-2 protease family protein [Spiractinospora alimapuensis]|uniref:site-2 protease family protein n=1 Tax=Spiractinospora alimapuensis TaxID=2820884 RepID=UPI001F16B4EE|nr:site-2 protease family protein [Spiractinospora alimapuensis]QVQ54061.1 site-2 protease family protein [Spiractinospora alimapuensis]